MRSWKNAIVGILSLILPERVKKAIFHLSFHLAPEEYGKFAYQHSFAPSMSLGLAAIANRGFVPKTIVDVGAFEGDWSKLAKRIWPGSCLIMIEPNLKKAELSVVAKELGARLISELVGAEDGKCVQFHVMESGSSVLSERSSVQRTVESRVLRTLDSLLEEISGPGLLKIDAQGYELQILKGACRILSHFDAILLEVAIIEINEGAPLLHEVVSFMKGVGFVTYDILEIHRRPLDGALNQIDIFFVRENSGLISDKRHYI